jgi:hypothetical protein
MPHNPEEPPPGNIKGEFHFVPLSNTWYNLADKLVKALSVLTNSRRTMTLANHEKHVKEIRYVHMREKQARRDLLLWLLSNHNNGPKIAHLDITKNIVRVYKNTPGQVKESRLNHEILLTGVTKELDPQNLREEEERFIAEKHAEYVAAHLLDSQAQ